MVNLRIRNRLLVCLLIFGACVLFGARVANAQGEPSEKDIVEYRPSPQVRVIPDLEYARYGNRVLLLDLYLPSQPGQGRPGVIVVRGGGWRVNDRKGFAHIASALAEKGIVAACIEYRTGEEAAFPGAIQDVKAAVRWMRDSAAKYGIDSHVIGTLGGSSGAHMALLAGLTSGVPEFEGNGGHNDVSSQILAVVAMATPTDLLSLSANNKRAVGFFLHVTPEQDQEKWRWASPVNHISAGGPPVLLLHGTADDSVPTSQSINFARRYHDAGANAEVVLLPGAPHAFWNYRPWFAEVVDRAATFFLGVKHSTH